MGSANTTTSLIAITFLTIFLLLHLGTAVSVNNSDTGDVCDLSNCGNGTCNASTDYQPFGYRCECESGWKRTRFNFSDNDLQFLPCIYPNCTMNYDCIEAPPPSPSAAKSPYNPSFPDPCNWIYCGEGTCNHTKGYKHVCECKEGYNNLLNVSIYPCFSNCMIGTDCARLGIQSTQTLLTNDSISANGGNQASLILPGNFHWLIFLMVMSLTMVHWK